MPVVTLGCENVVEKSNRPYLFPPAGLLFLPQVELISD